MQQTGSGAAGDYSTSGSANGQDFRHILDQLDPSPPPPPPLLPSLSSSTTSSTVDYGTSPRSVRTVQLQPRPSPNGSTMRKLFGDHHFSTFDSSQLSAATRKAVGQATAAEANEAYAADNKSCTASTRSTIKTEAFAAAGTLPPASSSILRKPQPIKRTMSLNLPSPPRLTRKSNKQSATSDADLATECARRDARIKALEDELRLVKCQRKQERAMAHVEITQLRKERSIAERQVEKFHADLEDKVAMEEYASLIQDMSPMTAVGPSHLSKLQTQLCKSLHNQGVLEGQIDFLKRECHTMMESVKDELATVLQERDVMEQELTKRIQQAEEAKRLQAKLFDERMASRVAKPCDVDTGKFVIAGFKAVGIAHRLERDQLQRERAEDDLRRKLDEKSTEMAELQAKVKSQQAHIGTLTKELDQKRHQEIRRDMIRTHRRHASHSTVVTSASTITRASTTSSSSSGIGGPRSGYSTSDTTSSSLSFRPSMTYTSTRPPLLHRRGSSDPIRGGHLIGSSPTW